MTKDGLNAVHFLYKINRCSTFYIDFTDSPAQKGTFFHGSLRDLLMLISLEREGWKLLIRKTRRKIDGLKNLEGEVAHKANQMGTILLLNLEISDAHFLNIVGVS